MMKVLAAALVVASIGEVEAASAPPPGAASCSGCHGAHGAVPAAIPPIHGRDANEITSAMIAFHDGARQGTVMNRIAKGFSEVEIQLIAAWLATQK